MSDVMKIAETRKSELENTIKSHEAEIAEMREEIKSLSEFMEYGNDLMKGSTGETEAKVSEIIKETPKAAVQSKPQSMSQSDFDDDFDPFEAPADEPSIAQLRPKSRPQSRPA